MAGADMSFGPSGLIEAVRVLDMSRMLFDREIFQAIDIISDGIKVNDETLAFDMIREVGPQGTFLGQRRTAEELPKLWPPLSSLRNQSLPGRNIGTQRRLPTR